MPLHFELVTPERLVRSEEVHMVVVPGSEGDFGVLEGHAPFMSTIRTASSPSIAAAWAGSPSASRSKAASPKSTTAGLRFSPNGQTFPPEG